MRECVCVCVGGWVGWVGGWVGWVGGWVGGYAGEGTMRVVLGWHTLHFHPLYTLVINPNRGSPKTSAVLTLHSTLGELVLDISHSNIQYF